jgi:hypothetical protein
VRINRLMGKTSMTSMTPQILGEAHEGEKTCSRRGAERTEKKDRKPFFDSPESQYLTIGCVAPSR